MNIQFFLVGYPITGLVFTTTPITAGMHVTALLLGLGSLAIAAIAKTTPYEWTSKFPVIKEEADDNSMAKKIEKRISFGNNNE